MGTILLCGTRPSVGVEPTVPSSGLASPAQLTHPPRYNRNRLSSDPSIASAGSCDDESPNGELGSTEFWPPFFGYRLKVTDTLVALFTGLLFFATCFLCHRAAKRSELNRSPQRGKVGTSTRSLAHGSPTSSKRQNRGRPARPRTRLVVVSNHVRFSRRSRALPGAAIF
jgi:hypothetical protein